MEHKCNSCFYMSNDRKLYPCHTCEGYNKYVNRNVYIHKSDTEEMIDWVEEDAEFDGFYGGSEEYVESVKSPKHYTAGKYEVIDVIEDWDLNFRLANTIKYIARHKHKGKPLEDLEKALWYLQREVDKWRNEVSM